MKAKSPRELIAQAAVVLAVCIGAWLMLVKPKIDELGRLDQQAATQAGAPNDSINQQMIEDAARRLSEVKERARTINLFNALADDSSRFYGIVMDLADTHGVVVQSLQPGAIKQSEADGAMALTRITLTAEGDYAHVASFLDSVCNVDAFIRPISLQLDPSQQPNNAGVQVTLTCDVLSFTMSAPLQELLASASPNQQREPTVRSAMGGPAHAQP